jgi:ectoine hydroxylase-related dioxygenase (phytanoyl-CoA dioxygenase family)
MVTSDGYLTAGVGYAFHPHRDTWYSAPMCQLNWWMPIYDFDAESALAFHPRYFDRPVRNDSENFNYYRWNSEGRKNAANHIKTDTRPQPKALDPVEVEPQLRVVVQAGGIVLFSPAHLHSTVPNTTGATRYSIDFRTVDSDDVAAKRGAANVDSAPTGTSLRDFMKGTDFSRFPPEVVRPATSGLRPRGPDPGSCDPPTLLRASSFKLQYIFQALDQPRAPSDIATSPS